MCEAEDKTAPHPHTSSASFKCGGRRVAGPAPPPRALGREGPHRSMPGSAGRASERRAGRGDSILAAPTLSLSSTRTRLPSSNPSPVPAPSSAAAAAASAPTGSARLSLHSLRLPQPISARLLPWPRSRLPPSCPPPSTGSSDGDRSCAAHPHPQTGILPTSPIARELRTGERQISRDSSPWQRLQQKQSVLEAKSGRGPMWGLESVGGGGGS